MTYYELNIILKDDRIPTAIKPLKTLVSSGFKHLTPLDFEALVLEVFEALGFSGSLTQASGDGGVDVLIESAAGLIVIQCKKYDDNTTIGGRELREFFGTLTHFKAVHGYFVTTSSFTSQAKDFSKEHNNMTLIDGECLNKLFVLSLISSSSLAEYMKFPQAEKYHGEVNELGFEFRAQASGLY